ncbi:MAG: hypothetical protein M0P91_05220 [Sulfuricurvum sp.]|jgi:hypothetical protein|uniref:hypothetical protein n=1 Tax=Sulfuricurvum sp. TaxID=2025608 RepID=UPI0025D2B661|nr:hypothetical protein [Sulfuricurvum sp.]MCK9372576.1 hypothetical protein [Sulfuricurvum sp.]
MASKVLSAKRQNVPVVYDFLDGTSTSITVQSISTNEAKDINAYAQQDGKTGSDLFEKIVRMHLILNEAEVVNRIIKELYEEGNVMDFVKALEAIISEAKQGK